MKKQIIVKVFGVIITVFVGIIIAASIALGFLNMGRAITVLQILLRRQLTLPWIWKVLTSQKGPFCFF